MSKKWMLGLASVIASTSLANAEPLAVTASGETTSYVQGGAAAGGDNIVGLYLASTLEGGYRLGDTPLWVHGMLLAGKGGGVDEPVFDSYMMQARLGVEARGCVASAICAIAGVDAAYRHEMLMAEYDSRRADDAIVIPRVGLDIGGRVRLRPGIELGLGRGGLASMGVTAAIAYQW